MEWTGAEQKALEHALSVVAKDLPPTERWQQIGTMVEGRTAKECVARYKELADAAKKKKADAAEAAEAERAAIKKADEAAAAEAKKKAEAAAHKKRAEEEFVAQQACLLGPDVAPCPKTRCGPISWDPMWPHLLGPDVAPSPGTRCGPIS